jgi:hypothetical protein
MNTNTRFYHISLSSFRIKIFEETCRKNRNTKIYSVTFLGISYQLRYKVQGYCTEREALYDNMAHARCMLDNLGYTHSIRICNIYCFSTANIFERTRTITRNTEEVQRKQ